MSIEQLVAKAYQKFGYVAINPTEPRNIGETSPYYINTIKIANSVKIIREISLDEYVDYLEVINPRFDREPLRENTLLRPNQKFYAAIAD